MPIRFVDKIGRTYYGWGLRLIEINMKNEQKPTSAQSIPSAEKIRLERKARKAQQGVQEPSQLSPAPTGPLQRCADKKVNIVASDLDAEAEEMKLTPSLKPVKPLQTCGDIEAVKAAKHVPKSGGGSLD